MNEYLEMLSFDSERKIDEIESKKGFFLSILGRL